MHVQKKILHLLNPPPFPPITVTFLTVPSLEIICFTWCKDNFKSMIYGVSFVSFFLKVDAVDACGFNTILGAVYTKGRRS